ncbi:5-hydroxyisourate hydrolase precursor [compost metagenome]
MLQIQDGNSWKDLSSGQTNADGRFVFDCKNQAGVYRINFSIEDYFKKNGRESFFMNTPVIFNVVDTNRKYHVPLLLNPFGYSTYRGS